MMSLESYFSLPIVKSQQPTPPPPLPPESPVNDAAATMPAPITNSVQCVGTPHCNICLNSSSTTTRATVRHPPQWIFGGNSGTMFPGRRTEWPYSIYPGVTTDRYSQYVRLPVFSPSRPQQLNGGLNGPPGFRQRIFYPPSSFRTVDPPPPPEHPEPEEEIPVVSLLSPPESVTGRATPTKRGRRRNRSPSRPRLCCRIKMDTCVGCNDLFCKSWQLKEDPNEILGARFYCYHCYKISTGIDSAQERTVKRERTYTAWFNNEIQKARLSEQLQQQQAQQEQQQQEREPRSTRRQQQQRRNPMQQQSQNPVDLQQQYQNTIQQRYQRNPIYQQHQQGEALLIAQPAERAFPEILGQTCTVDCPVNCPLASTPRPIRTYERIRSARLPDDLPEWIRQLHSLFDWTRDVPHDVLQFLYWNKMVDNDRRIVKPHAIGFLFSNSAVVSVTLSVLHTMKEIVKVPNTVAMMECEELGDQKPSYVTSSMSWNRVLGQGATLIHSGENIKSEEKKVKVSVTDDQTIYRAKIPAPGTMKYVILDEDSYEMSLASAEAGEATNTHASSDTETPPPPSDIGNESAGNSGSSKTVKITGSTGTGAKASAGADNLNKSLPDPFQEIIKNQLFLISFPDVVGLDQSGITLHYNSGDP